MARSDREGSLMYRAFSNYISNTLGLSKPDLIKQLHENAEAKLKTAIKEGFENFAKTSRFEYLVKKALEEGARDYFRGYRFKVDIHMENETKE